MARENNGNVTPDTSEIQAIKAVELFEKEAARLKKEAVRLKKEAVRQSELSKTEIQSRVKGVLEKMTKNPDFDDETMATLARACSHLAWFVRQRLNGGTVSGREVATSKTFEQLAAELLGRDVHLSAIMMHALATVVHGLYDGEQALPPDVLRECMRSMEEGRYPDTGDLERIEAAKAALKTATDGDDDNADADADADDDDDQDNDQAPVIASLPALSSGEGTENAGNHQPNNESNNNQTQKNGNTVSTLPLDPGTGKQTDESGKSEDENGEKNIDALEADISLEKMLAMINGEDPEELAMQAALEKSILESL